MDARIGRSDRAEVGVGTLIIFIAMVLVAAVAASVIIGTTGNLQARAQAVGMDATQEVASNLRILAIEGVRGNATDAALWDVHFTLASSAGALPIDLSQLLVRTSDGTNPHVLTQGAAALPDASGPSSSYNLTWIRGGAGAATFTMFPGDLVDLHFNNASLAPRSGLDVSLIPGTGAPVDASFRTSATFGFDTTIRIR